MLNKDIIEIQRVKYEYSEPQTGTLVFDASPLLDRKAPESPTLVGSPEVIRLAS